MQKLKNLSLKFPGLGLKTKLTWESDLLGYTVNGHFFTLELKVTKG